MSDFKKYVRLVESIESAPEEETFINPTDAVDIDIENELDVSDLLQKEIDSAYENDEDNEGDIEDTFDYVDDLIDSSEESHSPTFNYTATIQLHGYDFPLVLQSDEMDEIKTVMRLMKQSGLDPKGVYRWNSKTFDIDLDEHSESSSVE